MASSDRKVYSTLVNRTRWAESGSKLTTRVEKRSLKSYLCNRQRVFFFFFFLSFFFVLENRVSRIRNGAEATRVRARGKTAP